MVPRKLSTTQPTCNARLGRKSHVETDWTLRGVESGISGLIRKLMDYCGRENDHRSKARFSANLRLDLRTR